MYTVLYTFTPPLLRYNRRNPDYRQIEYHTNTIDAPIAHNAPAP